MQVMTEFGENPNVTNAIPEKGNRNYQDSVFKCLFQEAKYQKLVFEELHPELAGIYDESDFENIELENIFTIDIYNDVCFRVHNHLIILMEHQSTVNPNMPLRILIYLAEEYKRILTNSNNWNDLLSSNLVKIPYPEMYVIYTGNRQMPDTMSLDDAFITKSNFGGDIKLDIPVYTVHNSDRVNVLHEFTSLIDEIKYTQKKCDIKLIEAIRLVITKYMTSDYEIADFLIEKEDVIDMMKQQLTHEEIVEIQVEGAEKKGREEGRKEGREEERQKSVIKAYEMLLEAGIEIPVALQTTARKFEISLDQLKELISQNTI